jgi:beta-glucosidase
VGSNAAHVGRRELEETFLPQFQAAVAQGGALGIMSAYSEIDGVPNSANPFTLTQKLRVEWGFQGFVLSDLGAVSMLQYTHQIAQWPYQGLYAFEFRSLSVSLPHSRRLVLAISAYLTAGGNCQFYDYSHETWQESIVQVPCTTFSNRRALIG